MRKILILFLVGIGALYAHVENQDEQPVSERQSLQEDQESAKEATRDYNPLHKPDLRSVC